VPGREAKIACAQFFKLCKKGWFYAQFPGPKGSIARFSAAGASRAQQTVTATTALADFDVSSSSQAAAWLFLAAALRTSLPVE
jgi:hypothetical protein